MISGTLFIRQESNKFNSKQEQYFYGKSMEV